jgi:hypothetical protein
MLLKIYIKLNSLLICFVKNDLQKHKYLPEAADRKLSAGFKLKNG